MPPKTCFQLPRRTALTQLAAIGTGILITAKSNPVFSATECTISGELIRKLEDLGDIINDIEIRFAKSMLEREPSIFEAIQAANELLVEKAFPELAAYDPIHIVRRDQIWLLKEMQSNNLNPLKLSENATSKNEKIDTQSNETCLFVIISILLDTFELDEDSRKNFEKLIKIVKAEELIEEIVNAIKKDDLPRALVSLEKFLRQLFNRHTASQILAIFERDATKKILRALAFRLVPIAGWIILSGSLIISMRDNREKLNACLI